MAQIHTYPSTIRNANMNIEWKHVADRKPTEYLFPAYVLELESSEYWYVLSILDVAV